MSGECYEMKTEGRGPIPRHAVLTLLPSIVDKVIIARLHLKHIYKKNYMQNILQKPGSYAGSRLSDIDFQRTATYTSSRVHPAHSLVRDHFNDNPCHETNNTA